MEKLTHEGETLLLLLRRSGRQVKDVAELMEIKPTSLSRMFKSKTLTGKIKRRAAEIFGVPEGYFSEGGTLPPVVAEPAPKYASKPAPRTDADIHAENARLQAEIDQLRKELLEALRELRKQGKLGDDTAHYFTTPK